MNKEEIKFYSIGRGSLNLDGKFYYGLDYAITDFMRNLEQENKELHNKIDKALTYIDKRFKDVLEQGLIDAIDDDELEEVERILKGENE